MALMHTKGYAASETRVSLDQSRALIERARRWENLLKTHCVFSVLDGFWVATLLHLMASRCVSLRRSS